MANFKSKNLCDESSKIKNLRWQFSCIFRCLRRGVLRFFCRRCYHGDICRSKLQFLQISKKDEKWAFSYGKIRPLEMIFFCFFPQASSWPDRELRFAPPYFDRGLKTRISSNDRPSIINDHFRSFRQKNHFFSPIKIWSKWSLKFAPKPSVLRKKLIKATLKYTDRGAFSTY